jgi:FkbM family methyltransferase
MDPIYWLRPAHLRRFGFSPRTVIDVGVGYGTPTLYATYPDAYFVLIEPLAEFEPYMQDILKRYQGEYFLTAVGNRDERQFINVEHNRKEGSSFFTRNPIEQSGGPLSQREVPVTTLDALLEKHHFQHPFGLKIDTEGCEVQVIQGASRLLRETQFVIAEVAVADRFVQGYSFEEFIELMHRRGFRLCDIVDIGRVKGGKATFVDAVLRRA